MFLPVLFVREFGVAGWVVFAVPNVVGAVAMGWVIRDAQMSRRLIAHHAAACALFSAVTVAFNLFFALWFVDWLGLDSAILLFAAALLGLIYLFARQSTGLQALAVWTISLAAMAVVVTYLARHSLAPATAGQRPTREVLWLIPVCTLGFLTCPYLDLTFHQAAQSLAAPARHRAFGWGFGGVFLLMIVFTLLYAPVRRWPAWLAAIVVLHVAVQASWTAAIHARAIRGLSRLWIVGALVLAVAAWLWTRHTVAGLPGESIYLGFLAMYALVFPAYVVIVILPRREASMQPPSRSALIACAVAIALAAPCLYAGFFLRRMPWLAVAVLIVLLARYAMPLRRAGLLPRRSRRGIHQRCKPEDRQRI